jgi:membrane protein required for colicin V production
MLIDILFGVVLVFALLRGYKQGLIVGLFSLLAVIIGLAAALKLSAVVAERLGRSVKVSEGWLPFISFIIVFVAVVLLIRLGAKAIEKAVQLVMLGWLNRLAGMLLFVAIYTIVFSVLLFFAEHMKLIKEETIHTSVTYGFVQPWGPKVINGLGSVIPIFKDLFKELEDFFEGLQARF